MKYYKGEYSFKCFRYQKRWLSLPCELRMNCEDLVPFRDCFICAKLSRVRSNDDPKSGPSIFMSCTLLWIEIAEWEWKAHNAEDNVQKYRKSLCLVLVIYFVPRSAHLPFPFQSINIWLQFWPGFFSLRQNIEILVSNALNDEKIASKIFQGIIFFFIIIMTSIYIIVSNQLKTSHGKYLMYIELVQIEKHLKYIYFYVKILFPCFISHREKIHFSKLKLRQNT